MLTLAVEEWIGNAAAVLRGTWGAVTQRAQQSGYSRTAIYTHAQRVVQAVFHEQANGVCYETLVVENERLRAENAQLWQAWSEAEELSHETPCEFAATGSAMGLSLTQIMVLLAVVVPRGTVASRATIGRWVQLASAKASQLLTVLDRACQPYVQRLCLDEIFFHRDPVLVAVEPHSMVWVAGQRGPNRKGDTWFELLKPWSALTRVICDAGNGLERGVKLLTQFRIETAEITGQPSEGPVQIGLDVFHTLRELRRVLAQYWQRAERALEATDKVDREMDKVKRSGRDIRVVASLSRRTWGRAETAFDRAVVAEAAGDQIAAALAVFRPNGRLADRSWAQAQLDEAVSS